MGLRLMELRCDRTLKGGMSTMLEHFAPTTSLVSGPTKGTAGERCQVANLTGVKHILSAFSRRWLAVTLPSVGPRD
ncbi:hypothetical protein P170DRAFT_434803 [Aspergillus steynii IBT 23096]|uniref:Uncharacterized protein n=1 Tax=Aspergillus steynii IBT 23096 TaxID=1392250 RepID=A0A2I2GJN7_9EURO|nr:uncharacterized protein P170DRAFT_434803 [Aspergillus steynii IBT 23096]PLB53084.1 hypothetical protein P170DRAFT_434803 [Aspergillus steynii IBT 23096]